MSWKYKKHSMPVNEDAPLPDGAIPVILFIGIIVLFIIFLNPQWFA